MTTTTVSQEAREAGVIITRADRELFIMLLGFDAVGDEKDFHRIRKGKFDHWEKMKAIARHRQQAERGEVEKMRDILSNLSSYLGAGMGDDNTTPEQFDARIRWGIDHVGRVYRDRAAQVVEECSKRPRTTWGEVKRAILDDTCLPTALPTPPEAV